MKWKRDPDPYHSDAVSNSGHRRNCLLFYFLKILVDRPPGELYFKKILVLFNALPVPEFLDTVFAKTSTTRSFSMTENERFGLVFLLLENWVYKFGQ
jgi:hypothetical protein